MSDLHVALLIETSNSHCRALLQGIADYVRDNCQWSLYLGEHERGAPVPSWLRRWSGDGIIARIENEKIARAISEVDAPAVNVSATDFVQEMPTVTTNEETLVRMAFEHLQERGFREFAFCGTAGYAWSVTREEIFQRLIDEADGSYHIYELPSSGKRRKNWEQEQTKVADWLESLPKPVGLLASNDFRGQHVLDACRRARIAVPEQVAVISLGDDEVMCNLTSPLMTSVTTNSLDIGYKASAVLDQLMAGKEVSPRVSFVEPVGVHLRQSTDVTAIDDAGVVTALQMIRQQACDGIKVEKILEEVPLSRRQLELRFTKLVGRTLHEEILRVKLTHAKRLIAHSKLPLGDIAHRTGFAHASHMGEVFQNKLGYSPSEYRAKFRHASLLPTDTGRQGN